MSPAGSITVLVEHLKAGRHEAAQQLWQLFYPRLVALARKKLGAAPRRVADEEDVALSAFDSFCRNAERGGCPQLHDRDGLWSLLVVITARKAIDLIQHHNRQKRGGGRVRGESAFSPVPAAADGGGFDEVAGDDLTPEMAVQLADEFERLLDRLGDAELRSIAVWKLEGYAHVEIAQRLGCAEVTVERRLRLIRKILSET